MLNRKLLALAIMQANAATQRGPLFGGNVFRTNDKRDIGAWAAYGYDSELSFADYWNMSQRSGLAYACINMIVNKCWQQMPEVLTSLEEHDPNAWEQEFNLLADRISLFERLRGLDWRQRIGRYAGLMLFVDDGKDLLEPLQRMPSSRSLLDVRPFTEGQIWPIEYETDVSSIRYGQPVIYQLQEMGLGDQNTSAAGRSVSVHYSRLIMWSEGADDGTVFGVPALQPVFNSLVTFERIVGAGGVGFWKAARQSPQIDIDKDANLSQLAAMLGTDIEGLPDAMDEQIERWQKGFDQALMTQGMQLDKASWGVPDPKEFKLAALDDVAAGMGIPSTILIGQQTGRLASDEDQSQWAQTAESRQNNFLTPAIKSVIQAFIDFGFLSPVREVFVKWPSLQEPSPKQKLEMIERMAKVNKEMMGTGEGVVFTADEMRAVYGFEPLEESDFGEEEIEEKDDKPVDRGEGLG